MRRLPLVERLRLRRPCPAPSAPEEKEWTDGVRFCATCQLDAHDASLLTRDEAEALLRRSAGERVCFRTYVRRSDGAVLLADGRSGGSAREAHGRAAARGRSAGALSLLRHTP